MGKDQLDYIERELIDLLNTGFRNKRNSNSGNKSYISFENEMASNYLIDEVQRILKVSQRNVFIENEIIKINHIGGLDWRPVMDINSQFMRKFSFAIEEGSYIGELIKERQRGRDQLIFVEHEWSEEGIALIPKVNDGILHPFYLQSRDGNWPEDEDSILEFEIGLTDGFLSRSRLFEKLEELKCTSFTHNYSSEELNELLKSELSKSLFVSLSRLKRKDLKIENEDNEIKISLGSQKIKILIGDDGALTLETDHDPQYYFNIKDCISAIKDFLPKEGT